MSKDTDVLYPITVAAGQSTVDPDITNGDRLSGNRSKLGPRATNSSPVNVRPSSFCIQIMQSSCQSAVLKW